MILWFRNFSITLIILGIALIFVLPSEEARAESVSASIQVNSVCGDSVIEGDEQCEGDNFNDQTCESLGYQSSTLACSNCTFDTSNCIPLPTVSRGAGGGSYTPPLPAKVILKGRAYPNAILNVLKHGKVITTFEVDSSGLFEKELTDLLEGIHIFGIWAEDREGRRSVALTLPITVFWGMTATIKGIFISPTISLAPTQVEKGDEIAISGETFPGSEIHLFISPQNLVKKTEADSQGKWLYALDTTSLEEGNHYRIKAKAFFEEREESPFSQTLSFLVGPPLPLPPLPLPPLPPVCQGADFSLDDKINLVDFSILLYWWGQEKIDHPCVDINSDGKVDIIDFSIMMYYWTG